MAPLNEMADQVCLLRVLARRAGRPPKAEPGADGGPRRSAAEPPCFPRVDLGKRFKVHPAYIPRPATNGGSWLHLAAVSDEPKT